LTPVDITDAHPASIQRLLPHAHLGRSTDNGDMSSGPVYEKVAGQATTETPFIVTSVL